MKTGNAPAALRVCVNDRRLVFASVIPLIVLGGFWALLSPEEKSGIMFFAINVFLIFGFFAFSITRETRFIAGEEVIFRYRKFFGFFPVWKSLYSVTQFSAVEWRLLNVDEDGRQDWAVVLNYKSIGYLIIESFSASKKEGAFLPRNAVSLAVKISEMTGLPLSPECASALAKEKRFWEEVG